MAEELTQAELDALTATERIRHLGGAYSPYTPASQFQQYTAGLAPGLGRAARGMMDPAQTYYNLGLAGPASGLGGTSGTSFLDYLQGGGFTSPTTRMDQAAALGRARQAGRYAMMSPTEFYADIGIPETAAQPGETLPDITELQRQRLALRGLYGMGPDMASNQMQAARTMIGQQYGGTPFGIAAPLQGALDRVISELYNARLAQGREGAGFLNWILGGGRSA